MERKTKMPNVLKKRQIIALSSKIDGEYACKRLNICTIPAIVEALSGEDGMTRRVIWHCGAKEPVGFGA